MSDGLSLNELNNTDELVLPDTDGMANTATPRASAENADAEEKIILELGGRDADMITLPEVEVARLQLYADGSVGILPRIDAEGAPQLPEQWDEMSEQTEPPLLDGDAIVAVKDVAGWAPDSLNPLAEELFASPRSTNSGISPYFGAAVFASARPNAEADVLQPSAEECYSVDPQMGNEPSAMSASADGCDSGVLASVMGSEYGFGDGGSSFDTGLDCDALAEGDGYSLDSVAHTEGGNASEIIDGTDTYCFAGGSEGLRMDGEAGVIDSDYSLSPYDVGTDDELYRGRERPVSRDANEQDFGPASYTLAAGVNRRTAIKQIDRAKSAAVARARVTLREQELACLGDELSFSKNFLDPHQRRQAKDRRRRLKEARAAVRKAEREAEETAKRYYLPTAQAKRIITLSVNRERSVTLMDRLVKLCQRRDSLNSRLRDLYCESERGNHRGAEGRAKAQAAEMKKTERKHRRIAVAIHRERVRGRDREYLCQLMDEQVGLRGEIKAIEYSLNKEKKYGRCAIRLRQRRRELLVKSTRLKREISRLEIEGVRGARERRNSRTGMILGWSALFLLAVLGVSVYLFREPIWEWLRGCLNWIMDQLGWSHLGRL